ncbi:MAG: VOC family protein [Acidimicrobiia bacterium]|nr:VOC family protein [Acidimicrobiia bacterium]
MRRVDPAPAPHLTEISGWRPRVRRAGRADGPSPPRDKMVLDPPTPGPYTRTAPVNPQEAPLTPTQNVRGVLPRRAPLLAAACAGAVLLSQAIGAQSTFVWEPLIDHVQLNSDDVRKSTAFYQNVLGLNLLRVGPPNDPACCPDESAFFGVGDRLILAIRKVPGRSIDHYALMLQGFNQESFAAEIKRRGGVAPVPHTQAGFYVADPDGMFIQLMGQPGPPGKTTAPAPKGQGMTFEWAPLIDHMQVNSRDVRRSTEYYTKVLGLDLLRTGPPNNRDCCPDESAFFGVGKRLILAVRKQEPAPMLDHYALLMTNFNQEAVTKELTARGAPPKTDASGYHVVDPDGVKIQIMGQPGPP